MSNMRGIWAGCSTLDTAVRAHDGAKRPQPNALTAGHVRPTKLMIVLLQHDLSLSTTPSCLVRKDASRAFKLPRINGPGCNAGHLQVEENSKESIVILCLRACSPRPAAASARCFFPLPYLFLPSSFHRRVLLRDDLQYITPRSTYTQCMLAH